jgi:antitoxin VapB
MNASIIADGKTNMGKQLNIRSDEAYELAQALARQENKSVTRVVTESLRARAAASAALRDMFAPAAVMEREKALTALIERQRLSLPPGMTVDHSDLYDKDGLPI